MQEDRDNLNSPIFIKEIGLAGVSLPTKNIHSSDGFTGDYTKYLEETVLILYKLW